MTSFLIGVLIGLGLLTAFGIGYIQGYKQYREDRPNDRPDAIPGPLHF
jgi:hypothetical protein